MPAKCFDPALVARRALCAEGAGASWLKLKRLTSALLISVVTGCAESSPPLADAPIQADAPTQTEAPAMANGQEPPGPKAEAAPPEQAEGPSPAPTGYTPPYPERVEMFSPPNPEAASLAQRRAIDPDVLLKGIVNLDEPRVLLEIAGQVVQLREQEQHQGVQVVVIEAPKVTLQRGERRWTLSLLDDR